MIQKYCPFISANYRAKYRSSTTPHETAAQDNPEKNDSVFIHAAQQLWQPRAYLGRFSITAAIQGSAIAAALATRQDTTLIAIGEQVVRAYLSDVLLLKSTAIVAMRDCLRLRFATDDRIQTVPSHIDLSHVRKAVTANSPIVDSAAVCEWQRVMTKGEVVSRTSVPNPCRRFNRQLP